MSGREAICTAMDTGRYGRSVAACEVGGLDVQEVLVRDGLAWAYRQYSRAYCLLRTLPAPRVAAFGRRRQRHPGIGAGVSGPTGHRLISERRRGLRDQGQHKQARRAHLPYAGFPWYGDMTVNTSRGERWFCSEAEARAAGWRPARW
jgi:hypothetical protein